MSMSLNFLIADKIFFRFGHSTSRTVAYGKYATVRLSNIIENPFLQTHRHIARDADNFIIHAEIFRMNDIGFPNPLSVNLNKSLKGSCRISLARFDLNRKNLRLRLTSVGDKEINFNVVSVLFFTVPCIEEEFVSISGQALRNRIFKDHSLVDGKIVVQNLLIQFALRDFGRSERMTDQKASVAHIAFDAGSVFV